MKHDVSELAYYIRKVLYDEFKKQREVSGIEAKWRENEDAYNAVFDNSKVWKIEEGEDWRSKTVINKTKIKVYTAFAITIDMLLQGGKIPYTLIPSPLDEISLEDMSPEERRIVDDDISDMVSLIDQQFSDCNADRSLMKNVMAAAKYGETWSARYILPITRRGYRKVQLENGEVRFEPYEIRIKSPAVRYISNWNMFWDMETQDIQKGIGIIEEEYVCPYDLRLKENDPLWDPDAIERCISEASKRTTQKTGMPPYLRDIKSRHKDIHLLKFWGRVPAEVAEKYEYDMQNGEGDFTIDQVNYDESGYEVEIMGYVADNEVVRYSRTDGRRPYNRTPWEDNVDEHIGFGVADNVKHSQNILNGMIRAFEDNKKLSANVQGIVDEAAVPDWDKNFKPGMMLNKEEGLSAQDVFNQIIVADVGESLLSGISIFERYIDEESMLPRIMQGAVAEKQKPDTLGEINILQQNAGKYLGSVIRNFDETKIEPDVQWFFDYNMMDPNVTKGKGNYIAKALGFTSFENRVVRLHKMMQFVQLVMGNEFLQNETRIREALEEITKSLDLNPQVVLKSTEEKEAEAKQAAQMKAEAEAEATQKMIQMRLFEENLAQKARESEHEMEIETKVLDIEGKKEIEGEKLKSDLVKNKQKGSYNKNPTGYRK